MSVELNRARLFRAGDQFTGRVTGVVRSVGMLSVLVVSASLAGCAADGLGPSGLQLGSPAAKTGTSERAQQPVTRTASPSSEAKSASLKGRSSLAELARAHQVRPQDKAIAISYSRRLKAAGKLDAAAAVLEASASRQPDDRTLLVERGMLALERGDTERAQSLLLKSEPKEAKDWRALSALGVASSSNGDQAKAQAYFKQALAVSPNNPAVLNNLALSYVLDKKVERAEGLLRQASSRDSSPPQVTQNLMLVAALQGGSSGAVVESVTEKASGRDVAVATQAASVSAASASAANQVAGGNPDSGAANFKPLQPLSSAARKREDGEEENKFPLFQN
jgi:Flp pilus assembly protein TadD